jgi:hypothetical protein
VLRPLFIAGGPAPQRLTAIDPPLTAVAQAVHGAIDRPLVTRMLLAGDRDPATRLAGTLAYVPAAVPCIAHDALGAALGTAGATSVDGPGLQALGADHRLGSVPRRPEAGPQLAAPVGPPVDFGAEPAPAPASGCGLGGPCLAPAAWWGARIIGPSLSWRAPLSWPAAAAGVCPAAPSRLQMPALCQRSKRLATVRQGP